MWNWIAGNVNSLTETVQNTISSSEAKTTPNVASFPSDVSIIIEESKAGAIDNPQSDSSEHELDATEPASEPKSSDSPNNSSEADKIEITEDSSIMPNLMGKTNAGLNVFSNGISNLFNDVTGAVKSSVSEFLTAEEQVQKKTKDIQTAQANVTPPWYGYNEAEEMKRQILEISSSNKNLLREPPPSSTMHFSLNSCFGQAKLMLSEDTRLEQIRFILVPKKISEENFWRNYFYRVHLVKQSVQLGTLKREEKNTEIEGNTNTTTSVTADEIEPEEFVSDALDNQASCEHQLTQEELNQLKLSTSPSKPNEESNLFDMIDQDLKDFNPDQVKYEDIDYEDLDKMLKDD